MDDPLVGVTIWQSAQLHKKTQARQELLKQALGVDGTAANGPLSNGWAGGGGGRERVSRGGMGSGRREERTRGGRRREAERGTVSPGDKAVLENGVAGAGEDYEEEEEAEEELTERSLLSHKGGRPSSPEDHTQTGNIGGSPQPLPQNFWLMRLFESKLFDMSIAIGYFLRSKEPEVQAYLGNKLFVSSVYSVFVSSFLVKFGEH